MSLCPYSSLSNRSGASARARDPSDKMDRMDTIQRKRLNGHLYAYRRQRAAQSVCSPMALRLGATLDTLNQHASMGPANRWA